MMQFKPSYIARLAVGLRDNSRIMMKVSGNKVQTDLYMLALGIDRLSMLVWLNSEDSIKGINRPEMIAPKLLNEEVKKDFMVFDSPEAFEEAWAR